MFKALIFDMDGVIVDSEPIFVEIEKRIMKKYGVEITDEVLDRYVGISTPTMWEDLIKLYSLECGLEELLEVHEALKEEVFSEVEMIAIDGVRELLAELKNQNIPAAIASSSPVGFIGEVLQKLDIKSYFTAVVSGEEIEKGKPHPDIFLKAAELLGVRPEECVVIEDSMHGVRAAIAAGMKCIGFANSKTGRQNLSEATCVVNDLKNVNCGFINDLFRHNIS